MGLSSIASLSLGLSMSMTGAGRQVIKNLSTGAVNAPATATPHGDRRHQIAVGSQPAQPGNLRLPVMPSESVSPSKSARRTSFVGILHQMSTQNRLMERQAEINRMSLVCEDDCDTDQHEDNGTAHNNNNGRVNFVIINMVSYQPPWIFLANN